MNTRLTHMFFVKKLQSDFLDLNRSEYFKGLLKILLLINTHKASIKINKSNKSHGFSLIMMVFVFFISFNIVAQTNSPNPQPVVPNIPPSPEAMSFQIYGDHPVSHYTGLVNIDVPMSTIMVDEVQIPIKLSYHASGIKVNQTASNVGLGWSLIGTGVITRSVNGTPDEELTKMIKQPWFTDVIRALMESIFHGYSLIHLDDIIESRIKKINCIPREHIIPEKGWIVNNVTDTDSGFPYEDFPNELLYCQMYDAYFFIVY